MDSLKGVQMRALTTKNLAQVLFNVMRDHVGRDSEISRADLFQKLFKKREQDTLQDWLRWEFVKKAMHYCRQRTFCFISSRSKNSTWYYFVVKDHDDAGEYINTINRSIKSMEAMKKRAIKAADEGWHRKEWMLPGSAKLISQDEDKA